MSILVREPNYYREFHCAAGECPYNCCRDWKIPNRRLRKDKTCPMLRADGLCEVVCREGEEALGHTCHTFPRENHIYADVMEKNLSTSCPAVIELLWKQEAFSYTESYEEAPQYDGMEITDTERQPASLVDLRSFCMKTMARPELPPEKVFAAIHYLLLAELEKTEDEENDRPSTGDEGLRYEALLSEILIAMESVHRPDYEQSAGEWNELFLDISTNYRHQGYYAGLLNPLYVQAEEGENRWEEFTPYWDALATRMRLLLVEEIYATMLMPEGDLYSMTMKWQWMAMTYVCLRQAVYLDWCVRGELSERDILLDAMLVLRMMGYSEEDIEEYMDECFAEVIWDWSYMLYLMNTRR